MTAQEVIDQLPEGIKESYNISVFQSNEKSAISISTGWGSPIFIYEPLTLQPSFGVYNLRNSSAWITIFKDIMYLHISIY